MDRDALRNWAPSRRTAVVALCLCVLVGTAAGAVFVGGVGDGRLPGWAEVYPSLDLEEGATEELVHERINDARAERGLEPLSRTDPLTRVARNHSRDMADRSFFDHASPEGIGPETRVDRAGIACADVSENIALFARQNHEDPLAEAVVDAWLDSPGHLMNIVGANWERTGVGVVADEDSVYVTQVFCSEE